MDRIPRTCPEYQEEIPSVCKRKVSSCVPSFFPHYMRKILSFSPGLKSSVWTASFSVLCFCFLQRCQQWSQPYMTAQEIYLFMKKVSEGNLVRMSCWHWGQKNPVVLIQSHNGASAWALGMERSVMMLFMLWHSDFAGHKWGGFLFSTQWYHPLHWVFL